MPEVICPHCGFRITLKSRENLDEHKIVHALQSGSCSFSSLLRDTKLPRSTLTMRLNKLISKGVIVREKGYRLVEEKR